MKGGIGMPYIIKEKTLAILPFNKGSIIYEYYSEPIKSNDCPYQIININCYLNNSSLEGRQKASSYLIGTIYKPPIVLDETKNIIIIPTHSANNKACCWVVLNNILNYHSKNNNKTIIEFKNNQKLEININYQKFDKQVLRATRLESALRGRNHKKCL